MVKNSFQNNNKEKDIENNILFRFYDYLINIIIIHKIITLFKYLFVRSKENNFNTFKGNRHSNILPCYNKILLKEKYELGKNLIIKDKTKIKNDNNKIKVNKIKNRSTNLNDNNI